MTDRQGESPLTFAALLLTVAMGAVGFGIALPLLPSYARAFHIAPWELGLIFSIFSIGQAAGEAVWGRLSDRYGRKPMLMATLALSVAGYAAMAFAPSFAACLAARLLCGVAAGNTGVVQALMIDISRPERLTARLSALGASGSVGFVIGPAVGGLLFQPDHGLAGFIGVFLLAAGLSLLSALVVGFSVPSVRPKAHAEENRPSGPYRIPRAALALIGVNVGVMGAFAGVESIFGLWTGFRLDWSPRELGLAFATAGCVGAAAQLFLTARAVRAFGDRAVMRFGLVATTCALLMQSSPPNGPAMIALIGLASFGLSLAMPTSASLLSHEAAPGTAGRLMGANMAAAAVARILGPLFAGLLYSGVAPQAPFLVGAVMVLSTLALTVAGRAARAA